MVPFKKQPRSVSSQLLPVDILCKPTLVIEVGFGYHCGRGLGLRPFHVPPAASVGLGGGAFFPFLPACLCSKAPLPAQERGEKHYLLSSSAYWTLEVCVSGGAVFNMSLSHHDEDDICSFIS